MTLKGLRERACLSQRELAARLGITQSAISRLETGSRQRPHPRTLRRLAEALGTTPAEVRACFPVPEVKQ